MKIVAQLITDSALFALSAIAAAIVLVLYGCEAKRDKSELLSQPAIDTATTQFIVAPGVKSQSKPMRSRMRAIMNDTVLTLFIDVTNVSDEDLVVCPSYISIRRRGPSTVLFSGDGFGSSFDLEPFDQEPRQNHIYEPAPDAVGRLEVQFITLPAKASCTLRYEYKHLQRKTVVHRGPWFLYGELGLPAWYRAKKEVASVLDRIPHRQVEREYVMNSKPKSYLAEHVWWSIRGDSSVVSLSRDEEDKLMIHQVLGRELQTTRIPIALKKR